MPRAKTAGSVARDVASDLDHHLERRTGGNREEESDENVARGVSADPGAENRRRARDEHEPREHEQRNPALRDRSRDSETLGHVVDHEPDDEERAELDLADRE